MGQFDTLRSLGAPDAPGTKAGWRHVPIRGHDIARWAAAYIVLTAVAVGVGLLIVHVFEPGALGDLDRRVAHWFADRRTPRLNDLGQIGSSLSDALTLTPAIVATSVVFLVCVRRWNESLFLITAILLEKAVFVTTTLIVGRDRPPVTQLDGAPPTSSYPSGHVAAAVVFYVVVAIVITWHTRRVWLRALAWLVAVACPLAVALSRMLLGMHYLTDVVVGVVLALICIVVGASLTHRAMVDLDARVLSGSVDAGGDLHGRTEPQEAPAERDRAEREPSTAEAQSGDHVAGPMHAEQHS
jgi:membrane-associated phospholipid phosphatase